MGNTDPRWHIEMVTATVEELHGLQPPVPPRRLLRWSVPVDTALVLGRAQPETDVTGEGLRVVRRRSGGGAVLVVAGEIIWFDVVVPTGDPLWSADVTYAFHWLGDAIRGALASSGFRGEVHKGAMVRHRVASKVCFAGLGPGEVTIAGRKVAGISQRRTRDAAIFHCSIFLRHRSAEIAGALGLEAHTDAIDDAIMALPDLDPAGFRSALEAVLAGGRPR